MSVISLLEKNSKIFNKYITLIIETFYDNEREQDIIAILKNLETYEELKIAFPQWEIIEDSEIMVRYPHVMKCKQWQKNGGKYCCSNCSSKLSLPLNVSYHFKPFFYNILET